MKFIILGANGLIGRHFVQCCEQKGIPFVGTRHSRPTADYIPFNLLDLPGIVETFDREKPTVVVNSTGLAGGVNFCESNPEAGRKYHVESNRVMVDWCRKNNAAYVYISTDYVFDGTQPPYTEDDPVSPLNLYGKYKLEGEKYIRENLEQYVIGRTTNVYAWDPATKTPNFLMHLVSTLMIEETISVPAFLYGNPTYAGDLAAGIVDLLEKKKYGLYHIVGPENVNRYDWAVKCVTAAGFKGKTIVKLDKPPEGMVPRPLRSHLDNSRFCASSDIHPHGVDDGMEIFIKDMKS